MIYGEALKIKKLTDEELIDSILWTIKKIDMLKGINISECFTLKEKVKELEKRGYKIVEDRKIDITKDKSGVV